MCVALRAAVMRWALLAVGLAACSSSSSGPYDYAHSKGAAIYQDTCQVCHGETGEGGLGPKLRDLGMSVDDLVQVISQRMPPNAPGQCSGDCATELAQFVHDGLTTQGLACPAPVPLPRRLRLLTRREYRATVRDLFGSAAPAMACATATDCSFRDTCAPSGCEATACDAQTFVYDPHGQAITSVHVAGDFNGWAGTIAGGGLALARDANGLWSGTFTLGAGHHTYKLVIDESLWIADPRAPAGEPDGFGGQNSVVDLACTGTGAVATDPTADFPVETRRAGFPFDTDSDTALVTSAHVDAFLAAGEKLADFAAADPQQLAACDWPGSRTSCARGVATDLGRRLFRRPLSSDELDRYSALAGAGADASAGLATMLHAMLISPAFLYRSEIGEDHDGHIRLTGYELATALSFNLLGTTPGDELLAAAEHGELDTAAGLEKWARTLLADPRARTQVGELVAQWTGAQNILTADKRADLFPDLDDATRVALANETRNFAADVVFDGGGTFADLMTANYTVLDATAARFYGVTGTGHVPYDDRRAGMLGHAAVLASAAHSDQTSPILRGLLIRRNFLCEDLPPPPPERRRRARTSTRTRRRASGSRCTPPRALPRLPPVHRPGRVRPRALRSGRALARHRERPADRSERRPRRCRAARDRHLGAIRDAARARATIATSPTAQSCFVRQYLRFSRGLRETLAERCGRLWLENKLRAADGDLRELMVQSVLDPDFSERRQP